MTSGVSVVKLMGYMPLKERQSVLARFKTDPNVSVILMSLKTGGEGLNIQEASHVFTIEPCELFLSVDGCIAVGICSVLILPVAFASLSLVVSGREKNDFLIFFLFFFIFLRLILSQGGTQQ